MKLAKIPEPLHEKAMEVKREEDYASIGEVLRDMAQEAGYDV